DALKLLQHVEEQVATLDQGEGDVDLPQRCIALLDEVIEHDFAGEGVLSGPFVEDVDPDEYPEYYTVIANPTSFNNVKKQLKSG
ncbi:UNVERIFIED_CONTAM: bromodomain-containing protein, partial [Bacteroidetes bacterium 56_B9]